MDGQVTIYALCDESGAVRYVGQTRRLERRRIQHGRAHPSLTLSVIAVVDERAANEVERGWIAHYRRRGCDLLNVVRRSRYAGIVAVRLTQRRYQILERLAAREELPVAVVARRLLSERLDAIEDDARDQRRIKG